MGDQRTTDAVALEREQAWVGDAVLSLFSARSLDLPVVLLSADDSPETRDRARAAGFRFLPKPVSAARLKALLIALRNAA